MFLRHNAIREFLAVCLSAGIVLPAFAGAPVPGRSTAKSAKSPKAKKVAPPPHSTLEGQIFGADGKKGLRGAVLEVRPLDGGPASKSSASDSRGRFRVKGLDYGWSEVVIHTDKGSFLGDQAINLPPGRKVSATFSLLETGDRPESWWKDRAVDPPPDLASSLSGMAAAQQRLTGVEYWKSPGGIAILIGGGVLALGLVAAGGHKYKPPTTTNRTP